MVNTSVNIINCAKMRMDVSIYRKAFTLPLYRWTQLRLLVSTFFHMKCLLWWRTHSSVSIQVVVNEAVDCKQYCHTQFLTWILLDCRTVIVCTAHCVWWPRLLEDWVICLLRCSISPFDGVTMIMMITIIVIIIIIIRTCFFSLFKTK